MFEVIHFVGYIYICRLACKYGEDPRAGDGSSGRKRNEQIDYYDDGIAALISSLCIRINSFAFHNRMIVRLANWISSYVCLWLSKYINKTCYHVRSSWIRMKIENTCNNSLLYMHCVCMFGIILKIRWNT